MHWHDLLERVAATLLLGSGAVVVAAATRQWLRCRRQGGPRSREGDPLDRASTAWAGRALLAATAAGAAVIHLAAMPAHMQEYLPFGLAFGGVAALQLAMAAAALAGRLRVARVPALAITVAVIGAWLISHTVGLPFGPDAWHAESIGLADVIASSLEAAFILLVGVEMTGPRGAAGRISPALASIAVVPLIGIIGIATLLAAAAPGAAEHEHSAHAAVSAARGE